LLDRLLNHIGGAGLHSLEGAVEPFHALGKLAATAR
jgi:hypothetical protein